MYIMEIMGNQERVPVVGTYQLIGYADAVIFIWRNKSIVRRNTKVPLNSVKVLVYK
jgi:hypothetical protein